MAILKIARMGHPILAEIAEKVADPTARQVRNLVKDMHETLADVRGAGLAAPQVHVSTRLVIFSAPNQSQGDEKFPDTDFAPITEIINPEWSPLSDEVVLGWEGCLSVPGLTGAVPRFNRISYRGYTPQGGLIEREATGFHARVFQHEFDHLDGILYPMRMNDLSLLVFADEAQKFGLPSFSEHEEDSRNEGEVN